MPHRKDIYLLRGTVLSKLFDSRKEHIHFEESKQHKLCYALTCVCVWWSEERWRSSSLILDSSAAALRDFSVVPMSCTGVMVVSSGPRDDGDTSWRLKIALDKGFSNFGIRKFNEIILPVCTSFIYQFYTNFESAGSGWCYVISL